MILTGTDVDIELDAKTDLTQATSLQIRLKKPSGSIVNIDATANDTIAEGVLPKEDNDESGEWKLQVLAEFQSKTSAGAIVEQYITKKL